MGLTIILKMWKAPDGCLRVPYKGRCTISEAYKKVGKTQKMPCKITNYTLDGKYCDMKIYFTKQKRIFFRIFCSKKHLPSWKKRKMS